MSTTTRLAILDLDGVIADSAARFAKAEEMRDYYRMNYGNAREIYSSPEDAYWRTAFTPDLVQLDTLIDGVFVDLDSLISAGYRIVLLTSRPESMRKATETWLYGFGIEVSTFGEDFGYPLVMKPASAQFVKTVVWKSLTVEMLVRLFGVDDLMVIDDEPAIQEAIAALDLPCDRKIGGNLQEALAMLED